MIEAVNASISVAPSVRAVAQQMSTAESFAANPANIQKVAIGTNYSSQYIRLAPDTKPIFIVRDTSTGESIKQYPTESQLRAYQRAQQNQQAATQNAQFRAEVQGTSSEEAAVLVESSVQYKEVRKEVKEQSDAPPAPLPGHTTAEVNVGGDTGGDHKAEVRFSTNA